MTLLIAFIGPALAGSGSASAQTANVPRCTAASVRVDVALTPFSGHGLSGFPESRGVG
jgi:hypothetical protein